MVFLCLQFGGVTCSVGSFLSGMGEVSFFSEMGVSAAHLCTVET